MPRSATFAQRSPRLPIKTDKSGYTDRGQIRLAGDKVALIDPDKYQELSRLKWHVRRNGNVFYAAAGKNHNLMHRMVIGALPGQTVDHINGDGLDNRLANLWICTVAENVRNSGFVRAGKHRLKGVSARKQPGRYRAQIMRDGVKFCLGTYNTPEDAARAYDRAARSLFGEFARLNFPETKTEAA